MSDCQNLMVHVSCPFCKAKHIVSISGFAGQLASRLKYCSKCEKEYHVHLLTTTSEIESPSDGEIRQAKETIKYLKEQRKLSKAELLIKVEESRKLMNEALLEAQLMRDQYQSN